METPTITGAAYATSAYDTVQLIANNGLVPGVPTADAAQMLEKWHDERDQLRRITSGYTRPPITQITKEVKKVTMRIVRVFIADPDQDENLKVEDRLLYKGDEKLTDATDQELFFEVDIKTILDQHNVKRTATRNKQVKDKVEMLEPIRIRDLKMVVTTVASF